MPTMHLLRVPAALVEAMRRQARAEAPLECCGLLAGRVVEGVGEVEAHYPLVNEAASPVAYLSEPRSMFQASRAIDRAGLEVLAVYHSHPTSAPIPSKADREANYSEVVVNLILSLTTDPPEIRAWWLTADTHREAVWEVQ